MIKLLLVIISLLHVVHQILDIHLERKSAISVQNVEEVLIEIPSVPANDGFAFVSPLRAEVQLIPTLAFQKDSARVILVAVG